jgi:5-methylcytosine-specific restriction endonuclease McrA
MVEQHCMYCGVSVGRHLSPRYCSDSCRWGAYKSRRPDVLDVIRTRQRTRYATSADARRIARQSAHRRRTRLADAFVEEVDFAAVFVRDGGRCRLCGEPIDAESGSRHPRSASYDHIVPLARGGLHVMDNLQLTHLRCNLSKGRKLMTELRIPA